MTQEEFKVLLDKRKISYKQEDKWLIIDNTNNNVSLSGYNLKELPEYLFFDIVYLDLSKCKLKKLPNNLIFNCKKILLSNNDLLELHENIIFTNKLEYLNIDQNKNFKIKHIGNILYFDKIFNYRSIIKFTLDFKLQFEKIFNRNDLWLNVVNNEYQTPHICLTKVLNEQNDKSHIIINLPKNFLSISSWI